VLNTKPEEIEIKAENRRIVDIQRLENGKYFIYCYHYSYWSLLGGGWTKKQKEMQFVIPVR